LLFEYFDEEKRGQMIAYEEHKVTPNAEGIFSVILTPDIQWQNYKELWLQLSIDNKPMTPRERILTQPYAQHSKTADNAENSNHSKTADNAENSQHSKTADNAEIAQRAKIADNAEIAQRANIADSTGNASNGVPVGTVIAFAGTIDKAPTGYLLCNGDEKEISKYEELSKVIGSKYGTASGGKFKLPNFQGVFLRGAGSQTVSISNKGSDPSANKTAVTIKANGIGEVQGDAIRNIDGTAGSKDNTYAYFSRTSGVFELEGNYNHQTNGGGGSNRNGIRFNASLVVPTSNENRPVNYAVYYYIKY
jgi:hypothetical protein